MSRTVSLSKSIYPLSCLRETEQVYKELCKITVLDASNATYSIEIRPDAAEIDEDLLKHELLNYLLDVSVERYLATVNAL